MPETLSTSEFSTTDPSPSLSPHFDEVIEDNMTDDETGETDIQSDTDSIDDEPQFTRHFCSKYCGCPARRVLNKLGITGPTSIYPNLTPIIQDALPIIDTKTDNELMDSLSPVSLIRLLLNMFFL